MAVRAKFRCVVVEDYGQSKKVKFTAVCSAPGEIGENERFTRYTPSGEMWMTVDNPAASEQFVPGEFYYLDMTPAPAS